MASALQRALLRELAETGPLTSVELADRVGVGVRAVSNSMTFVRGRGEANDGSTVYEWPDKNMGCMHRPKGPIIWALGPSPTVQAACPFQPVVDP